MSLLKVNSIEPATQGGHVDIYGFKFLEKLLGDVTYRGDWVTGVLYRVKDIVIQYDRIYRANTTHTSSGTFDSVNWDLIDVSIAINGTSPGDYSKVRVDETGRVIAGLSLIPSDIPYLSASKITSGTFPPERLGSGTPSSNVYLRGDGSWSSPNEVFGTLSQVLTATEGQTVFTLTSFSYTPGAGTIAVYLNGIRMTRLDDYDEVTGGTSITFKYGLIAGDNVTIVRGERYTSVTDPVIREQLFADTGSTLIGHGVGTTVADKLNAIDLNWSIVETAATAITLSVQHTKRYVRTTSTSPVTITVDAQATSNWPTSAEIRVEQGSTGSITFVPGSGVTLNKLSIKSLSSIGQYAVITLKRSATDVWTISGDLA